LTVLVHAGDWRFFNVFFPKDFNQRRQYPLWIHIHGVYWATMGDISSQMGYTVPAMDATPNWDKIVEKYGDKAIIVYPQSTGDPFKRMVSLRRSC
jgi:enterochelin esterase-like enzyme